MLIHLPSIDNLRSIYDLWYKAFTVCGEAEREWVVKVLVPSASHILSETSKLLSHLEVDYLSAEELLTEYFLCITAECTYIAELVYELWRFIKIGFNYGWNIKSDQIRYEASTTVSTVKVCFQNSFLYPSTSTVQLK